MKTSFFALTDLLQDISFICHSMGELYTNVHSSCFKIQMQFNLQPAVVYDLLFFSQ